MFELILLLAVRDVIGEQPYASKALPCS